MRRSAAARRRASSARVSGVIDVVSEWPTPVLGRFGSGASAGGEPGAEGGEIVVCPIERRAAATYPRG
jgi:hypothetical protein